MLTVPKLKDLVNKPQAKYNTIYKSLQNTTVDGSLNLGDRTDDIGLDTEVQDNNSTASKNSVMTDELMKYVKELSASSSSDILTSNDIVSTHNMNYNDLSNDNAGGIATATATSTCVNNNTKYMRDINNISSHPMSVTSAMSSLDYGTPTMSSSYSSLYSPY